MVRPKINELQRRGKPKSRLNGIKKRMHNLVKNLKMKE